MRRTIPLITMMIIAGAASAIAQPARRPAPAWDSRGWVPLGERTVNGRVDRDRIEVGRYEGKFSKLNLVVEDSDLELIDFKIVFGDNTEYHPKITQVFREGARTRAIDLPPSESVIRFVDIRYKNLPGGGNARVQLFGWRTADAAPQPAPVPPPVVRRTWDTRGWQLLGSRTVNGRVDRDRIEVGRYEGKLTKLTMAVEDSDLELLDFRIEYDDRTEFHPRLGHMFRENQRTRVIDLPPSDRAIRFIDIKYKNTRGGGAASVEVWGFRTAAAPPPPSAPAWDAKGWTLLGERTVDGRVDRDRIEVGRYEGKFTKLTLVVEDSDLELLDFTVQFASGAPWRPALSHYFREGQRTRAIDLPGDERTIRSIDFRYRNLPGGGRAKVAVYARRDGGSQAWDPTGWTMLGEQRVNSNRTDTDKISVRRYEKPFRKLTIVVLDSDLEMIDLAVKFGQGEPFHPQVNQVFRENSRTREIDLPGDRRKIRWIEFKYRNLPGGGRARVQVWAR